MPKPLAEVAAEQKLMEEQLLAKLAPFKTKLFELRAKRERPFLAVDVEGHALIEVGPGQGVGPVAEFLPGQPLQGRQRERGRPQESQALAADGHGQAVSKAPAFFAFKSLRRIMFRLRAEM